MSQREELQEPQLTDSELRELRALIEADRRFKWFWATARSVTIWISAAIGALIVGWDALVRLVLHAAGK